MKKIVLFLHGYGSNGSDLITLKDYLHLNQSETEFISPNAPEPCEFNYFGYQWFALNERTVEEIQTGLKSAFFYLDNIVNDIKKKFEIDFIKNFCFEDKSFYSGDLKIDMMNSESILAHRLVDGGAGLPQFRVDLADADAPPVLGRARTRSAGSGTDSPLLSRPPPGVV